MTTARESSDSWRIGTVLQWTGEFFGTKGIESARLDAELLLAAVLNVDRIYLYTHYDQPLSEDERARYRALIKRRAAREPIHYILGEREFYGRAFAVDRRVLVPRPETEHVVDAALEWIDASSKTSLRVLDLCTGSGAIAITLACERPHLELWATDISPEALQVASANVARHGVEDRLHLLSGDLLAPVAAAGRFDVIVSNPPYVRRGSEVGLETTFEPELALFAADAGMAVITKICDGVQALLAEPGFFACEIGAEQGDAALAALPPIAWREKRVAPDLQGHARVLIATR